MLPDFSKRMLCGRESASRLCVQSHGATACTSLSPYSLVSCQVPPLADSNKNLEGKEAWEIQSKEVSLQGHRVGWRVPDIDLRERGKWRVIIMESKEDRSSWNVRAERDFSSSNPHFVGGETEA